MDGMAPQDPWRKHTRDIMDQPRQLQTPKIIPEQTARRIAREGREPNNPGSPITNATVSGFVDAIKPPNRPPRIRQ